MSEPSWREVLRSAAEAAVCFYLLCLLYGWDVMPRWFLVSVAVSGVFLNGVAVVAGSLILFLTPKGGQ